MKLFGKCEGCAAKDAELARMHEREEWYQKQVDQQNRRLLELADPNANARLVQADRLDRKPVSAPRAAPPPPPVLPGSEPSPPRDWEVDAEAS